MSNILTCVPWTRQPQITAGGIGASSLLLNFTSLRPPPNESRFSPQTWTTGASSVIRPAAGGIGLYCGSSVAGNALGSAGSFDAFSPASTAAWMAVVITGAAYASQGSGVNIIASYGSANAASGWYFYLDSSSNLGARCGSTDITTTLTLAAGRVYHIVACRTAAGVCELWANGVRVGSGTGATAAVAGNAFQLYVGGDSGTARAYQGTVHSLSLGTRDIVGSEAFGLSQNEWQLFAPLTRRIWVPSAGGATTHTSTGALASQAAAVAGTATHKTLHASTGAIASQAAAVAGTATHKTLHASTGTLASQTAAIAGTATHTTPSGATHTATGALAAQAAEIAGTAIHRILHTSTGDLIAQSAAVIAGTAIHYALHTSSGALASQSATMSGSASGPGPDDVSGDTIVALRSISHNTHRRM